MAATNQTPGPPLQKATILNLFNFHPSEHSAMLQKLNGQIEYKPSQSRLKAVASLLLDDMVDIFVGPKRKKYHVHKDLLCNRSEHFRAMFQGGYKETQTKEVFLIDEDASAVELFVTWIYGTTLRGPMNANESSAYLGLLVLSEKFLIEQLHNECIDLIRAYFRDGSHPVRAQDVKYVCNNLNDLKLCHFLIRLVAKAALNTLAFARVHSLVPPALPQECQDLIHAGDKYAMSLASFLALGPEYLRKDEDTPYYNCAYHGHSKTERCRGPEMGLRRIQRTEDCTASYESLRREQRLERPPGSW